MKIWFQDSYFLTSQCFHKLFSRTTFCQVIYIQVWKVSFQCTQSYKFSEAYLFQRNDNNQQVNNKTCSIQPTRAHNSGPLHLCSIYTPVYIDCVCLRGHILLVYLPDQFQSYLTKASDFFSVFITGQNIASEIVKD